MNAGFKLALITLPIAAIGAGILAFVVSNSPPPARVELTERARAVRVVTAAKHVVVPRVLGFGLVMPVRSFEAIAEVGGTVEDVNPDLRDGQILPEGAVLLRLSPTDFNLAIAQARANIRAAEARLAELNVSEASQHTALEIERAALAVKSADLARAEALLAAGSSTEAKRDAARGAHLAQRQKVQGIEAALALFPTQRAVQIEQIAVYETNLASAELNLARSTLSLPFAARVTARNVETGQYLKAGQTAATLDGIDQAEIDVQVPLDELRALLRSDPSQSGALPMDPTRMGDALRARGLTAEVRLRLGSDTVRWPATVDRISGAINASTGTVGVVVRVEAAYGQAGDGTRPPLTRGMFVDVVLRAPPVTAVVLPRSALHDGQIHVADSDNRLRMISATPQLVQGGIALFGDEVEIGRSILLSAPDPVVEGLLLDPHPDTTLIDRLLAEDAAR